MTRLALPGLLLLAACGRSAPPSGGEPRVPEAAPTCDDDFDCGWDDPCMATRCVVVDAPQAVKCEESSPRPGTCACVDHACTLRPKDPPVACATWRDCSWETAPKLRVVPSSQVPRPVPRPVRTGLLDAYQPLPVAAARSWLLTTGWRRHHALLGVREVPGPGP